MWGSDSPAMPNTPGIAGRRNRRRRQRSEDAKPAYALAALFATYYAIGTMAANWDLTVALVAGTAAVFWVGAVISDAMHVRLGQEVRFAIGRWGVRHEARRAARRTGRLVER